MLTRAGGKLLRGKEIKILKSLNKYRGGVEGLFGGGGGRQMVATMGIIARKGDRRPIVVFGHSTSGRPLA
jgi:hypothetical protein